MRRADVIIVLGARVRPDGRPSAALGRRVAHGIALFRAGLAPALLLTGGASGGGAPEAATMRAMALAAGIPEDAIVIEPEARNSFENARHSRGLMKLHGWSTALVVTDWHHLPRALLAFRGMGVAAHGAAAHGTPLRRVLAELPHETLGLAWYALRLARRRIDGE